MRNAWQAWLLALLLALPGLAAAVEQPFVPKPPTQADAQEQAKRQQEQPFNNAPMWREVRSGETHVTQIRGVETGVLVQTEGEIWRVTRNNLVTPYGGLFLAVIAGIIAVYYFAKGPMQLHEPLSGRKLLRFTAWERYVHWTVAVTFVILALSGLVTLFGKHVLLPVIGYTLFSWVAAIGKGLHNFVGPLFLLSAAAMFVTYVRHNLPAAHDLNWVAKAGGMLSGEHVPSGRFNAGEKAWFWIGLFVLTIVVGVTGLVLDFPNFEQGRETMQQMNVIHAIAAIVFMGFSMGHIYMGTLGVPGAYEAMRNDGMVDETWAKEHHELWYDEMKAGKGAGAPAAAQPQHS